MSNPTGMNRRDFMVRSAGAAALSPLVVPAVLGAPGTPDMVVARGGGDRDPVDAAYRRTKDAVARMGDVATRASGKHILIKVNATERRSQDGNTSPAAAAGLLRLVREWNPAKITVLGQEWGGYDSPRAGQPTLRQVIKRAGADLVELPHYWSKNSEDQYKLTEPEGDVWNELWVAKLLFDPDTMVLNLARVKTHPHCVYTGVIKNVIGLTRRMYGFHKVDDVEDVKNRGNPAASDGWHVFPRKLGHAFRDVIGPRIALNILDAGQPTYGWRGPAKERIETFDAHTTIVGTDALAMDVYGCEMLHKQRPDRFVGALEAWAEGENPYIVANKSKQNYLLECGRIGLGETDLGKVDIEECTVG